VINWPTSVMRLVLQKRSDGYERALGAEAFLVWNWCGRDADWKMEEKDVDEISSGL